jgi:hypothetical protein
LQAVGRLAADGEHLVARTYDTTFSACFDPINILY